MSTIQHLINGYKTFKATQYEEKKDIIAHLVEQGTHPSTMVVTSSELRISPDLLTSSNPGELFVMRTLGGLVPPYSQEGVHGIIASIEYALNSLKVENIIVLGHAQCRALREYYTQNENDNTSTDPLKNWFSIAKEAKTIIKEQLTNLSEEEQIETLEKETVVLNLKNLFSYPWINERIDNGSLTIYGWHFNILTGSLLHFDPQTQQFEPI